MRTQSIFNKIKLYRRSSLRSTLFLGPAILPEIRRFSVIPKRNSGETANFIYLLVKMREDRNYKNNQLEFLCVNITIVCSCLLSLYNRSIIILITFCNYFKEHLHAKQVNYTGNESFPYFNRFSFRRSLTYSTSSGINCGSRSGNVRPRWAARARS